MTTADGHPAEASGSRPVLRRWLRALARRLLRPLLPPLRMVAVRIDLGGAGRAEEAARGASSLRASLAAVEVTLAEQEERIDALAAEVAALRAERAGVEAAEDRPVAG